MQDITSNLTCTPTDPPSEGCSPNGVVCSLCGPPLPGRGYDGNPVFSSTIHASGDNIPSPPDFIMRDDCGTYADADMASTLPLKSYVHKTGPDHPPWPGATNAWCELNQQVVAADSIVNREPLYQGKTLDVQRGYAYDFFYCKYNDFLTLAARQAVSAGFDAAQVFARDMCAQRAQEFDISNISRASFVQVYGRGMYSEDQVPTADDARHLGAWLCAMGGSDGLTGARSDGNLADIGYCHYTYGDLDPTYPGEFCMYEECDGWDPLTGQLVSEYHTASNGHAPPTKLSLTGSPS